MSSTRMKSPRLRKRLGWNLSAVFAVLIALNTMDYWQPMLSHESSCSSREADISGPDEFLFKHLFCASVTHQARLPHQIAELSVGYGSGSLGITNTNQDDLKIPLRWPVYASEEDSEKGDAPPSADADTFALKAALAADPEITAATLQRCSGRSCLREMEWPLRKDESSQSAWPSCGGGKRVRHECAPLSGRRDRGRPAGGSLPRGTPQRKILLGGAVLDIFHLVLFVGGVD